MKANFDLDPVQWSRLRGLLDGALALAPAERATWIERLGPEDEDLKPRLRALLAHAAGENSPLDTLPQVETAQFLAERAQRGDGDAPAPGAAVGPYRLIRPLGEGGMGEVWLAERSDMLQRRQVALKLPRLLTGRAALAERLAREREILAALNHPNIARLYDAGLTADGQPYLALEYVEGERIDAYCQRKALDVPARLRLFVQVARAVAHAHAQLVVHRDLKPANILVTEAGDVKLLDFGIAKLLEDGRAQETELTQLAGRALTPEYAAPEQILGQPLATSADVYALGVLLFELLTGSRPYRLNRGSRAALEEAIVQAEPARPSSVVAEAKLKKRLRGDLDTITLKALKKAPAERYSSVEALADDLERHLDQRPVLAQPDSRLYRLHRFVARNRGAVALATAFLTALALVASVALWQAFEARAQHDLAERERQRTVAVNEFLQLLLEDVGTSDKPRTLANVLDRSTELLERRYEGNERAFAPMLYEASRRYATIGNVARELQLLNRVATTARDGGDGELLAATQCSAARALIDKDRAAAQVRFDEASRALAAAASASTPAHWICARAQAALLESQGDTRGAIAALRRALAAGEGSPSMTASFEAALRSELGHLQYKGDDVAGALESVTRARDLLDRSGRGGTMSMAVSLMNRAAILQRAGEVLAAAQDQERVLALVVQVQSGGEPPIGFAGHYASSLLRLARYGEAVRLATAEGARARSAGNTRVAALADLIAARALTEQRQFDAASRTLARAEADLLVNSKANQRMLNEVALARADQHLLQGSRETARAEVDAVLARLDYPQRRDAPGLGSALHTGARVLLELGEAAGAERYAADAYAIAVRTARSPQQSADAGQAALHRAAALVRLGQHGAAVAQAELAQAALLNGFGPEHPETKAAGQLLASLRSGARFEARSGTDK